MESCQDAYLEGHQYVVRKNTRESDIHGEKRAEKPHSERTHFLCSEQPELIVYVVTMKIEM